MLHFINKIIKIKLLWAIRLIFKLDIRSWNITNVIDMNLMLNNSGLFLFNYDAALISWSEKAVQPNVALGAFGINCCDGTKFTTKRILKN